MLIFDLFDDRSFVPGARAVKTSAWFSMERISKLLITNS